LRSPPGTECAYTFSVVEAHAWLSRWETVAIGTPAASICVAIEVAKVVEAEVRKARGQACGDEVLGYPVGLPRRRPVVAQAEDEGVVGKLDSRRPRGSRFA
jgi:hypothetical protein